MWLSKYASPSPLLRFSCEVALATLLISHPSSLEHQTPPGHPERPDRIRAVERALANVRFGSLTRRAAARAARAALERVHPGRYLDRIEKAAPASGLVTLDSDTTMSPGSLEAALRAAGAGCAAVDAVLSGEAANAFCAVRPPGHHAERETAMGFCLFNSIAVAARHAQSAHGVGRVAIVDWDVHHGNGTQDVFWADPTVLFASTHQMPLYPGTGAATERGERDTIVNVPLAPGDGGATFRAAFSAAVLPRLEAFAPELVLISAGFDAHRRDPLANLELDEADFAWATRAVMDVADRHAGGRIVSMLEGGYDLEGLARSVDAHVTTLMAH